MNTATTNNSETPFYHVVLKSGLKTALTVLFTISIHVLSVELYLSYCINTGMFSLFYSLLYVPTPQCRILLDVIKHTSDFYVLFWYTFFSFIFLNFETLKKTTGFINYNMKYFKF